MSTQTPLDPPCQTIGGMTKIGEGEAAPGGAIRGAEINFSLVRVASFY